VEAFNVIEIFMSTNLPICSHATHPGEVIITKEVIEKMERIIKNIELFLNDEYMCVLFPVVDI